MTHSKHLINENNNVDNNGLSLSSEPVLKDLDPRHLGTESRLSPSLSVPLGG